MTAEELKNVAGFKAVDAEGNELGVVSLSDIVSAVKQELQPSGVARASVAALSEVSAQAATDTYEDQLPQKTDATWIRGLDASGNPILISKQSLASVLEGLIFNLSSEIVTDFDAFIYDFKIALGRNVLNSPISGAVLCISIKASTSSYYRQFVLSPSNSPIYTRSVYKLNSESNTEWEKVI